MSKVGGVHRDGGPMLLHLLMQTSAESDLLDLQCLPVGSRAVPVRPVTTGSQRCLRCTPAGGRQEH